MISLIVSHIIPMTLFLKRDLNVTINGPSWQRTVELTGQDPRLDQPLPFEASAILQVYGVKLVGEGEDVYLQLDTWEGDHEIEGHPNYGKPVESYESGVVGADDTANILDAFISLVDAPDRQIELFAERYGLLGLCDIHGIPWGHTKVPGISCGPADKEMLKHWKWLARRTLAILRIAADLHWSITYTDQPSMFGVSEDWAAIPYEWQPSDPLQAMVADIESSYLIPSNIVDAREALARYVNESLEWAGVHPVLNWFGDIPFVEVSGVGAWRHVANRLLHNVASNKRLTTCTHCGALYTPQRMRRTRPRYCPQCKSAPAARVRKQRQRSIER